MLNGRKISRDVYSRAMSGVSVAKKNGGQTSAIFANDTRWRPNSQILHRRDRSHSRVTETARPSGVLIYIHPLSHSYHRPSIYSSRTIHIMGPVSISLWPHLSHHWSSILSSISIIQIMCPVSDAPPPQFTPWVQYQFKQQHFSQYGPRAYNH